MRLGRSGELVGHLLAPAAARAGEFLDEARYLRVVNVCHVGRFLSRYSQNPSTTAVPLLGSW